MKKIFSFIFLLFIIFCCFYIGLPVLNYGFIELPFLLILIVFILMLMNTGLKTKKNNQGYDIVKKPNPIFLWIAGLLFIYITIVPFFTTAPIFKAKKYQELIGEVSNGNEITKQIEAISIDEIRVVDKRLAYLLGEKILGSQPALGSQVELGDFFIQKVDNELYWVAPLLYSGFFKWLNEKDGTPGYVMVSATNERDVSLVQTIDNKPIKIKYQPNAYFQSEIHRHVYMHGYTTDGLDDFSFEIDDAGNPFWIITLYKKRVGFSGNEAIGVLIVDAQNGEIKEHSIENTPIWVDRIQPASFVEDQLNDWGEYVHGYWNFSNREKLQITEGLTLVYGKDDKSYWYTGITSVGKDESAVGFVLVDTRTKETTFYKQSGATEYAAQSSAEGKVQEKNYRSSLPIPYNINNIPTYVMTLKDDGGLVKMYAMVAISDYTIVGVGNTLRETLTSYKNVYNTSDNKINNARSNSKNNLVSTISRFQIDVKNGNSFYYFMVDGSPNIFVGSSQISNQLPVSKVGDSIKVSYDLDLEEVTDVASFENLSIVTKSSSEKSDKE
uniref:hypothetical protein n=1 Tax=Flavobacterium sp. TaxID=239 RepID=UPI00404B3006